MSRQVTWSNMGIQSKSNDFDALLRDADLDYTAVAKDLYVNVDGSDIIVPSRKMIMREDSGQMFGIVSDKYKICQNRDALDFIQYIDDLSLQKAGSTSSGLVYMIGSLPEVSILGDKITPNLIFQNSHDGSSSISATICMQRIVCQNQFIATFAESPATVRVSHMGNMEDKLIVAKETLLSVNEYVRNFDEVANDLATKKVTKKVFNQILEEFFKTSEEFSDKRNARIEAEREDFMRAYNEDDNANFVGTKWGMVNAYSDYLTHYVPARMTESWEEKRFLWNLNPKYMNEFLQVVAVAA